MNTASTNTTTDTYDLVLSYAAHDSAWVQQVAQQLAQEGLRLFDPFAVPEQYWGRNREELIPMLFPQRCPVALVALSAAYGQADSCQRELRLLVEAAQRIGGLLLPVRMDDTILPDALGSFTTLDGRALDVTQVAAKMLAALQNRPAVTTPLIPTTWLPEERLNRSIDLLPDDDRRLLNMKYFQSMNATAMAKQLGISEGTVRGRLFLAIQKLQALLEQRVTA